MSTVKIEKDGLTALENFLSQSNIIESYVNSNDKYPSWDGELLVYTQTGHKNRKSLILGRVPVQIKSKKRRLLLMATEDKELHQWLEMYL
ncbi:MAG TPA: hypothetical protein GX710_00875, partial [Clostridiales bacterium]|nr:hypothetical protein [Clostridiales bacterium]